MNKSRGAKYAVGGHFEWRLHLAAQMSTLFLHNAIKSRWTVCDSLSGSLWNAWCIFTGYLSESSFSY